MSGRCWCCSMAGAACSETAWCRGASAWRKRRAHAIRNRHAAALHRDAALVRGQGRAIERARIIDHVVWQEGAADWLLAILDLGTAAEAALYFMPLALAWEEGDEERVRNLATSAVAQVRQQANVGVMGDAFADEAFCRAVIVAMSGRRDIATRRAGSNSGRRRISAALAGTNFAARGRIGRWLRVPTRWWSWASD